MAVPVVAVSPFSAGIRIELAAEAAMTMSLSLFELCLAVPK